MNQGLEGVVAAQTELSMVDGERGVLIIAGYPVEELAPNASFEEVVALLGVSAEGDRTIPPLAYEVVASIAEPMDALRAAAGLLNEKQIFAAFPTIVAAHWRTRHGRQPIAPREDLGHAANYLYMLSGERPSAARVRALDTYLNTVIDHGLNASTFAARVIVATQSDLVSAVVGALGALKGPLHGGAPGPALDMVFEIGSAERAEPYLRAKLERGERLMGFGHRVYKTRDPRADVLSAATADLFAAGEGDQALYALVQAVEAVAIRLLDEYKPGRNLRTNVEFYTALLLQSIDVPTDLFTPTFALSRVAGWLAHCFEQAAANRLIRPLSLYEGPRDRTWVPLEGR